MKLTKSFGSYLVTLGLGAFNDHFFKMILQIFVLTILAIQGAEDLIAWAALVFTTPFVLFAPWAGYLADRYCKVKVMRWVKLSEIIFMSLGFLAFYLENMPFLIVILFLMASQSAFFSPAKSGFIPETLPKENLGSANGLANMITFMTVIFGSAIAGILLDVFDNNILTVSGVSVGIALSGYLSSFFMVQPKQNLIKRQFPLNPFTAIVDDLKYIYGFRDLFVSGLSSGYFWFLGLLFQTNILVYAVDHLGLKDNQNTELAMLPAIMGIGIALGSLLGGRITKNKIRVELVPLVALVFSMASLGLYFSATSYLITLIILFIAGIAGGVYMIPVHNYLQHHAPDGEKGRILSTAGMLDGSFLIVSSLIYRLLAVILEQTPKELFLSISGITLIFSGLIYFLIRKYKMHGC